MNDFARDLYLVEVNHLEKTYYSEGENLTILKDLDLAVRKGTKNTITGASGCGKSTLLNIIASLDSATAGTVRAGDYVLTDLSENELSNYRSKFLGLIFQFHYLLKDFTALENVFMPAYMSGVKKRDAMDRARALLTDVGLQNRMHHLPSQLSGGERQRVACARALVNDPTLILADEPTGNLDPKNGELVGELLFNLVDQYDKTLVLVTHDAKLAEKGDVLYHLEKGRLYLI